MSRIQYFQCQSDAHWDRELGPALESSVEPETESAGGGGTLSLGTIS